jgi:CO/xanthine dehydrogenase Mo-binding subunit
MATLDQPQAGSAVGMRRPRIDGRPKVIGDAPYAADLKLPGLLYARPVLSPYAHAQVRGIDRTEALAVPGVRHVLTFADLPIKGGTGRQAEPLADREVVFAGQPVALVLADSDAAAEDGADAVVLDLEPLEPVLDALAAMAPSAALAMLEGREEETDIAMHGDVGEVQQAEHEDLSDNVFDRAAIIRGDVDEALARCAATVEGRFHLPWIHQAYMETQTAVAWPEGDGGIGVRSSTQGIFYARAILGKVYGLPPDKVRVEGAVLGGGFGAKLGLIEPLVAGAVLATGAPVRLALSRTEDFAAANPAPAFFIDLKLGASDDGALLAMEGRVVVDNGAFTDSAPSALVGGRLPGPYRFETARVRTYGVRTNRCNAGAYRAPTGMQCCYVIETLLDELAAKLGMDPIDLREANALDYLELKLDGTPWPSAALRETLEELRAHPLWTRRDALPENEGVGLASGLFPGGKMGASAGCRMDGDGGFTILSGYVDMSGTDTTVTAIAAEILGLPAEKIRIVASDTDRAPHAGVSGGSMVTYCLGNAVQAAAEDAREQILAIASDQLEIAPSDLELAEGTVRPIGVPARAIPLEQIAAQTTGFGALAPIEGHGRVNPPELSPSAAAVLAHVRVDPNTGDVEVLDFVAVQDVGRAINPSLCEGQMRGGAAQAIGFALQEAIEYDEDGQLLTGSFMTYALPRFETSPDIETIIVEVPSRHGPLGARGIGESAIVPGGAAIGNAVAAATGVRFRSLPLTPARVWHALQARA